MASRRSPCRGFTLIELLVVMTIMATLLGLVAPRYFKSLERAREAVLRTNLKAIRDGIDKFHGDTGRYPRSLDELVATRYLSELPLDPMADRRDTWGLVGTDCRSDGACRALTDIRSGAPGAALDGTAYSTW
jgi:general secretion pathway protein G